MLNKSMLKLAGAAFFGLLAGATAANATTIFSDNFTRADSNTVGNSWSEIQNDADDVAIVSPGGSNGRVQLRDEDGSASVDAAIYRTISTLGYNSISLSFDWDRLTGDEENDDFLIAEWRIGSGTWTNGGGTNLATYDLDDSSGFLSSGTLLLGGTAANQANIQIRFRTNVSQSGEGALIDNVLVSGNAITAPVPEPLTLSLFGAGLVGAFAARRRKTNA
jgi:hypothetical protein